MDQERRIAMLKQIAEYYKITRNVDFAKFFDLSEPTAFNRLKTGFIDYEQVYQRCPDISGDWLLSGEGPMLRAERESSVIASNNTNIGNGANQQVSVVEGEALKSALEALKREQETVARAQEQISGLIEVLKTK